MAKQSEQNTDRYYDVFPTMLRGILESHPKDGHSTTYKALGEAVGVRQQTISQYASGQTQPTADVVLRIAQFFGVSVDYLLTGVSSYNKEYSEELGLSESQGMTDAMKDHFKELDIEGYFVWQLQMYVQEFVQKEVKKLGLDISME